MDEKELTLTLALTLIGGGGPERGLSSSSPQEAEPSQLRQPHYVAGRGQHP